MPTVVRVEELCGEGDRGAEILLRAVADAKTEHMARLVARQRDADTRWASKEITNVQMLCSIWT